MTITRKLWLATNYWYDSVMRALSSISKYSIVIILSLQLTVCPFTIPMWYNNLCLPWLNHLNL